MKCIQADYVKIFQCDGKICNSRCCRDWQVPVDADILKKFQELDDADRAEIFKNFVEVEENFHAIKLTPQNKCSFLNADFLCKIQKRHGENFLPAICQTYPRVIYKLDAEIFLQSMTLTCPVAARLILLREDKIFFEVAENFSGRMIIDFTKKISQSAEEFLNLQFGAIKILQDRNFSINQRLKKLCDYFGVKNFSAFDAERHAAALVEIFAEMYQANLDAQGKKTLCRNYLSTYKNLLAQMEQNFSHILENYLVNEFFMRCYPCAFKGDELLNCKIFVTAFKVLQFALVLTTIANKNFTVGELIKLVCAVNDTLDHSKGGMNAIINFAKSADDEIFSALMIESLQELGIRS